MEEKEVILNLSSFCTLSLLPARKEDAGTQRIRLSAEAADSYKISFGSCVRVSIPDLQIIGTIHHCLDSSSAFNCVQVDPTVTENQNGHFISKRKDLKQDNQQKITLQILKCKEASRLEVKLVVENRTQYQDWLKDSLMTTELARKCFYCIRNKVVTAGCKVELSHSKLGKLFGFNVCIVLSCGDSKESDVTNAFRVTEKSLIQVEAIESWEHFNIIQRQQSKLKVDLGGVEREIKLLRDMLQMPWKQRAIFNALSIPNSSCVLLRGPPGCGKTSLVHKLAQDCQAALVVINGPEMIDPYPGESEANLKKVFEKAVNLSREGPCILFIDEIDSICQRSSKSGNNNSMRLTGALLSELDHIPKDCGLVVVAATNRPSALDPAVRCQGRLEEEVYISVPSHSQRCAILEIHTKDVALADDVSLDKLAAMTGGYVGADLARVCTEAVRHVLLGSVGHDLPLKLKKVTMRDMVEALLVIQPSLRKGVECLVDIQPVLWEDIGGLEHVKMKIRQAVEWPLKYPAAYKRMGLPLAQGVLLYGPPGCGKTTLVRAAATASHVTFLSLSGAQLYSPFVGDSEQLVTEAFQKARALAPSILFLDELDSTVGSRSEGSSTNSVQERVLSTLLNEMDGVGIRHDEKVDRLQLLVEHVEGNHLTCAPQNVSNKESEFRDNTRVLVVAATNRPDLVDDALLRPGRMDHLVYVPPPDAEARVQILGVHTHKMPLRAMNLQQLASLMEGYTGADIENVCREAALFALTEDLEAVAVGPAHFQQALGAVKPSLTKELEELYKRIKR